MSIRSCCDDHIVYSYVLVCGKTVCIEQVPKLRKNFALSVPNFKSLTYGALIDTDLNNNEESLYALPL